jgi:hypothetical protein
MVKDVVAAVIAVVIAVVIAAVIAGLIVAVVMIYLDIPLKAYLQRLPQLLVQTPPESPLAPRTPISPKPQLELKPPPEERESLLEPPPKPPSYLGKRPSSRTTQQNVVSLEQLFNTYMAIEDRRGKAAAEEDLRTVSGEKLFRWSGVVYDIRDTLSDTYVMLKTLGTHSDEIYTLKAFLLYRKDADLLKIRQRITVICIVDHITTATKTIVLDECELSGVR